MPASNTGLGVSVEGLQRVAGNVCTKALAVLALQLQVEISCPSCLQGLTRYREDAPVEADYIVVELARHLIGADWQEKYIDAANAGGIERVLL